MGEESEKIENLYSLVLAKLRRRTSFSFTNTTENVPDNTFSRHDK